MGSLFQFFYGKERGKQGAFGFLDRLDEVNIPDQGQKLVKQGNHIPSLVITLGKHRQSLGGIFFAQSGKESQ